MTDILLSILSSTTICGILTASLIFLSKSWISERLKNAIKNEYDLQLENYKFKLKFESDVNIEKLKTQLQISTNEHNSKLSIMEHMNNTKFSRIDSDRAKAIKQIYFNLFELEYSGLLLNEKLGDLNCADEDILGKALAINNECTTKFNEAAEKAMNNLSFYSIYFSNKLFSKLYSTVDSFITDTKKLMDKFQSSFQNNSFGNLVSIKSEYQNILESNYLVKKYELTEELRSVLGSNSEPAANNANSADAKKPRG